MLKPLYAQAVREWPLLGTPVAVAAQFENTSLTLEENAGRLIALYTSLCGATGFVCGAPGLAAAPVTLPLNITGVALLQLHMCAALATLGGFDMHNTAVREQAIRCLVGHQEVPRERAEVEEGLERVGIKMTERGVRLLGEQVAKQIGKGVTRRLPLVGGVIGSVSDSVTTRRVGKAALKTFITSADESVDEPASQQADEVNEN